MMYKGRRAFLKEGAMLASGMALSPIQSDSWGRYCPVRDAGMELCLAYFWGIEPAKVALALQMDVKSAVGGISPAMVDMKDQPNYSLAVIKAVQEAWKAQGLRLKVIEGPPALYEKTKLGLPGRDEEIEHFILFLHNIAQLGIDTVCGGALVSAFDITDLQNDEPITRYGTLTHDQMWDNMEYFLKAVIPEAESLGVKLALHPDDPPVDQIRGIPRIMTSVDAFKKMLDLYPSPSNGITFCQGSFASMGTDDEPVDIPAAIEYFGKRNAIHFVHFRDVRGYKDHFEETFHDDGKTDMYRAMETYYKVGYRGPLRPDHVPTMYGDSNVHPGYSTIGILYAIGYIRGLMEGVSKSRS